MFNDLSLFIVIKKNINFNVLKRITIVYNIIIYTKLNFQNIYNILRQVRWFDLFIYKQANGNNIHIIITCDGFAKKYYTEFTYYRKINYYIMVIQINYKILLEIDVILTHRFRSKSFFCMESFIYIIEFKFDTYITMTYTR